MTLPALVLVLSPFVGAPPVPHPTLVAPPDVTTDAEPADPEAPPGDPEEDPEAEPEDRSGLRSDIPEEQRLAEAGDAFNRGVEAFKEERFEDALRHFGRAQQLAPHPDTLYNLALSQQLVGRHLEAYGSFEELISQTTDPEDREELRGAQAQSRAHLSSLRVRVDPPRPVCFDGARMSRQDGELQVLTTPGEHRLEIDRDRRTLQLEDGESRTLELQLRLPTAPPPPRRALRVLGGFAIGGASAAAGLGLGAGLAPDQRMRLGLGAAAAGAGVVALTTTIVALVVHRRARRWTPPEPHDPCPVPAP